jgi:hypothetical protein
MIALLKGAGYRYVGGGEYENKNVRVQLYGEDFRMSVASDTGSEALAKALGTADIASIAKQYLNLETLETRNSDSLDFHDTAVWQIKAALQAAFNAGLAAAQTK